MSKNPVDVDPKRISVLTTLKQVAELTAKQANRAIQTAQQAQADYQTAFEDVCERHSVSPDEFDLSVTQKKLVPIEPAKPE